MKQIFVHRMEYRKREREGKTQFTFIFTLIVLFVIIYVLGNCAWTNKRLYNQPNWRPKFWPNFAHFSSCCFWFPFAPYTQLLNPTHMFINNLSKIFKIQVLEVLSHLCHTPRRRQRCLVCVTNLVSFKCRLFMMTQKFCFDPDYVHLHFHINNKIPCGWKFTSFMYKYYTHDKDRSFFAYNLSL